MLNNKSILVTGATGSFGKAFVRAVLERYSPSRLIIFSRDELKQYDMAHELKVEEHPCLRYFIGDVRDLPRLRRAMQGVDYVVHAAAMKHVPIAEYNPFECIRTNIGGAENVINAAIDAKVKKVIALSTDKAANPLNLYGATKLASDKCFIAANHMGGSDGTRFSVVRYGNVIGSRGSVVEYFSKLVADGATELPVTDMRMTRFWITLQQGVDFVIDRLAAMTGGELFIPKIASMKLTDLARSIGPDCTLKEVGIRPGEKLHEVLLPRDEARHALEFRNHYTVEPAFSWWCRDEHLVEGGEAGRPVPEGFEYSSECNTDWIHDGDLEALIKTPSTETPVSVG
ncbi:MAG: UDP-N-acetylglucosamine 4,6-dehydratase [Chlamydiales bacterium]|jgi:UDP-N-acetylglucosamine 4,6-dehydratase